jgi:hypothetical protein
MKSKKSKQRPKTASRGKSASRDRPVTPDRSPSPIISLKVTNIDIGPNKTVIAMIPISGEHDHVVDHNDSDNDDKEEDDIIYPFGVTDRRPYRTVARYRKAVGQSVDFCQKPLHVADDSVETLILGLESFAQQHGCDLSFANEGERFDKSIYRAAMGVVDLGSVHLLATDSLLTAHFQFEIDLDYDSEITQSKNNVEKFVFDFRNAISTVLSCDSNNVRVFSIDKLAKKSGRSHINFGLTASEPKKTEQLADNLKVNLKKIL